MARLRLATTSLTLSTYILLLTFIFWCCGLAPKTVIHSFRRSLLVQSPRPEFKETPATRLALRHISAPDISQDIQTIYRRRLSSIVGEIGSPSQISSWLRSLGTNGKWPDSEIDYTTGCAARRANWPAQAHWQRICTGNYFGVSPATDFLVIMAGAWHGGLRTDTDAEQWVRNNELRNGISRSMAYWFGRDITNVDCMDWGGTSRCPCENADNSLWNTNWFSNIILIPELVGESCLLLNDSLTADDFNSCARITRCSYGTFDVNLNGVGYLSGANTLDIARIGVDCALANQNASMLSDAYRRVHEEMSIRDHRVKADDIRADGSFGQHAGILYNGNYGKDYSNALLDLEVNAAGSQFAERSVDLWSAWLDHTSSTEPLEYTTFPGLNYQDFLQTRIQARIQTLENGQDVSAIYDHRNQRAMMVFWKGTGQSVMIQPSLNDAPMQVATGTSAVIMISLQNGNMIVSDPSQTLDIVFVTITMGTGKKPQWWTRGETKAMSFQMPKGGQAGNVLYSSSIEGQ